MNLTELTSIVVPDTAIQEAVRWRQHFHQYPELSEKEYQTQQQILQVLTNLGLEVHSPIAETGLMGVLKGNKEGKTVLVRADMDALPVQDEKQVPYRSSVPNVMHACGHDAHMAILLGLAMALREYKDRIQGTVKFVFQPAEETVGGGKRMIDEGVMDLGGTTDYALALHMDSSLACGEICITPGYAQASSDMLTITFKGKGCHGASPHMGVDALLMAGQFLTSIQTVISRNIDPLEGAVLSFGTIEGGEAPNVVAREVQIRGILRTLNKDTRNLIVQKIQDHVQAVEKALGGNTELDIIQGYPSVYNDPHIVEKVKTIGEALLGADAVHIGSKPRMGVEDFAYFLQEVPGCMWRLGCACEEKGITAPLHNPNFDIDHTSIALGIKIQMANVLYLLSS